MIIDIAFPVEVSESWIICLRQRCVVFQANIYRSRTSCNVEDSGFYCCREHVGATANTHGEFRELRRRDVTCVHVAQMTPRVDCSQEAVDIDYKWLY